MFYPHKMGARIFIAARMFCSANFGRTTSFRHHFVKKYENGIIGKHLNN